MELEDKLGILLMSLLVLVALIIAIAKPVNVSNESTNNLITQNYENSTCSEKISTPMIEKVTPKYSPCAYETNQNGDCFSYIEDGITKYCGHCA